MIFIFPVGHFCIFYGSDNEHMLLTSSEEFQGQLRRKRKMNKSGKEVFLTKSNSQGPSGLHPFPFIFNCFCVFVSLLSYI